MGDWEDVIRALLPDTAAVRAGSRPSTVIVTNSNGGGVTLFLGSQRGWALSHDAIRATSTTKYLGRDWHKRLALDGWEALQGVWGPDAENRPPAEGGV